MTWRDLRNILERASARETAARVACGACRQLLARSALRFAVMLFSSAAFPTNLWNCRGMKSLRFRMMRLCIVRRQLQQQMIEFD